MKKTAYFLFTIVLIASTILPQDKPKVTLTDYERAESFFSRNLRPKIYKLEVIPNWLDDSTGFSFTANEKQGKIFYLYNFKEQKQQLAFDHKKLASLLSESTGSTVKPDSLPFNSISFIGKNNIEFNYKSTLWNFNLVDHKLQKKETKPKRESEFEQISPDSNWVAFTKDYNLFIRSSKTGQEIKLSTKGERFYEYGSYYGWDDVIEHENGERPKRFWVSWSPDSKKIFTQIVDMRNAKKMYLLNSAIDTLYRPKLLSYYRGSPGDTTIVYYKPVIFDIETKQEFLPNVKPVPHFMGIDLEWAKDSKNLVGVYMHRGYKQNDALEINASTGNVRTVFSDFSETSIDLTTQFSFLEKSGKALLLSQRTGWNHIYLFDWKSGKLLKAVTQGEFVVKNIVGVDEEKEIIYFIAGSREQGRNPYLNHFYKVKFDGSNLTLLTPENANHNIYLSPGKDYFVDNFSRVDLPTQSVLHKTNDGSIVQKISEADISKALEMGWKYPEVFSVKARDGKTDLYGAIWKPTNFSPDKKYPVIDNSYSGPHYTIFPKGFSNGLFSANQSLAEFGFIVLVVDGLGTSERSQEFRNWSYRKLGYGVTDHVIAIRELGKRYNWVDTTCVGIYGHSAGGYDATHAMLLFPDFYKVAVSSSADHDHRMEKAWWPEMYMGYPIGDYYHQQSNITMAGNLKGKLLLVHGLIDENVNPSATVKLADALIRANKEFDLLILPASRHGYDGVYSDYFTKKRWNYFIQNLLGADTINYEFKTK